MFGTEIKIDACFTVSSLKGCCVKHVIWEEIPTKNSKQEKKRRKTTNDLSSVKNTYKYTQLTCLRSHNFLTSKTLWVWNSAVIGRQAVVSPINLKIHGLRALEKPICIHFQMVFSEHPTISTTSNGKGEKNHTYPLKMSDSSGISLLTGCVPKILDHHPIMMHDTRLNPNLDGPFATGCLLKQPTLLNHFESAWKLHTFLFTYLGARA